MTGDQRFFLAFAQSWRTKTRDKALRRQIATDGHAPGSYRALTVRNLDDWYKAFDVQPGQKLYLAPDKRVHVWWAGGGRFRNPDCKLGRGAGGERGGREGYVMG